MSKEEVFIEDYKEMQKMITKLVSENEALKEKLEQIEKKKSKNHHK